MTLENLRRLLQQAQDLGTIESIYFEGGEPFLYYGLLLAGTREAARLGFEVGVVSNGYWATSVDDALEWLRPFAGLLNDLSISIAQPEAANAASTTGQLPAAESAVMYRGRAAQKLAVRAPHQLWTQFAECPYENLREPGRIHVDPFGNVHICQGIALGNVFRTSLKEICEAYDPESHPIIGPLLTGGPAELARRYQVPHAEDYADACHLCDDARRKLRQRFPEILMPDQMYAVIG
jgi:MoaA/NifB/PqqE/SkfB family radical SAM enzyme